MRLNTKDAANICCVTPSYFLRLAKALEFTPVSILTPGRAHGPSRFKTGRGPGVGNNTQIWEARHVIAVMLGPLLTMHGVRPEKAREFCSWFGKRYSDERLEAAIETGQVWVLVAQLGENTEIIDSLLFKENIEKLLSERADQIEENKLVLMVLGVKPLWDGIGKYLAQQKAEDRGEAGTV